nr:uncharacterized protein LOC111842341 [Paramormyrops kingsleyae]
MQRSSVTLAEVHDCLSSTRAIILKYKSRPGPRLKTVLGTNLYEGISLRPCDEHSLHQTKGRLIDLLSETMLNRFEDMNHGILSAMRLTNFCYWPEEDINGDFGDSDIQDLVTHFKPLLQKSGVKVEEIQDQWTILKSRIYQNHGVLRNITWPAISRQLDQYCPDILHVVDLILSIPASTADCERGFSAMKLTLIQPQLSTYGMLEASGRQKELDEALVDLIVKDSQPFSIVEDEGFRNFVKKLDPNYILPSRNTLKAMLKSRYRERKDKAMEEVKTHTAEHLKEAKSVLALSTLGTARRLCSFFFVVFLCSRAFWRKHGREAHGERGRGDPRRVNVDSNTERRLLNSVSLGRFAGLKDCPVPLCPAINLSQIDCHLRLRHSLYSDELKESQSARSRRHGSRCTNLKALAGRKPIKWCSGSDGWSRRWQSTDKVPLRHRDRDPGRTSSSSLTWRSPDFRRASSWSAPLGLSHKNQMHELKCIKSFVFFMWGNKEAPAPAHLRFLKDTGRVNDWLSDLDKKFKVTTNKTYVLAVIKFCQFLLESDLFCVRLHKQEIAYLFRHLRGQLKALGNRIVGHRQEVKEQNSQRMLTQENLSELATELQSRIPECLDALSESETSYCTTSA